MGRGVECEQRRRCLQAGAARLRHPRRQRLPRRRACDHGQLRPEGDHLERFLGGRAALARARTLADWRRGLPLCTSGASVLGSTSCAGELPVGSDRSISANGRTQGGQVEEVNSGRSLLMRPAARRRGRPRWGKGAARMTRAGVRAARARARATRAGGRSGGLADMRGRARALTCAPERARACARGRGCAPEMRRRTVIHRVFPPHFRFKPLGRHQQTAGLVVSILQPRRAVGGLRKMTSRAGARIRRQTAQEVLGGAGVLWPRRACRAHGMAPELMAGGDAKFVATRAR